MTTALSTTGKNVTNWWRELSRADNGVVSDFTSSWSAGKVTQSNACVSVPLSSTVSESPTPIPTGDTSDSSSNSSTSTSAIAGGVVGGVVGGAGISLAGVFFLWKKKKKNQQPAVVSGTEDHGQNGYQNIPRATGGNSPAEMQHPPAEVMEAKDQFTEADGAPVVEMDGEPNANRNHNVVAELPADRRS